jgi:hypothetical protein
MRCHKCGVEGDTTIEIFQEPGKEITKLTCHSCNEELYSERTY